METQTLYSRGYNNGFHDGFKKGVEMAERLNDERLLEEIYGDMIPDNTCPECGVPLNNNRCTRCNNPSK
jgi:hypothetical protein